MPTEQASHKAYSRRKCNQSAVEGIGVTEEVSQFLITLALGPPFEDLIYTPRIFLYSLPKCLLDFLLGLCRQGTSHGEIIIALQVVVELFHIAAMFLQAVDKVIGNSTADVIHLALHSFLQGRRKRLLHLLILKVSLQFFIPGKNLLQFLRLFIYNILQYVFLQLRVFIHVLQ